MCSGTILINNHIFVMLRHLQNALFCNFTCGGQRYILRAVNNRLYTIPEDFLTVGS